MTGVTGCPESNGRPNGGTCEESSQCASGLCYDGACLDPNGDDDGDGLLNGVEAALGTNPFSSDSDGDGIDDLTEVGADPTNPLDVDGDGRLDALEPANGDSDGDCVFDQFDGEERDIVAEEAAKVCPSEGVCGERADERSATCVVGVAGGAPVWTCDLTGVTGYDAGLDSACDGDDNDCDGVADEDFVGESTTCGAGACTGNGVTSCVAGEVVDSCMTEPAEDDATCDGVDDDCDNATDEDYAPQVTNCGVGACAAAGMTSCVAGTEQNSCSPGTAPSTTDATCDGVDDDCSGDEDEDYVPSATTCGTGPCGANGVMTCVDGSEADSCTPGQGAPSDTTCNGVDDDCNGADDDGYVNVPTACGVGMCAANGANICVEGDTENTCTPGTPQCGARMCGGNGCGGGCGTCGAAPAACVTVSCDEAGQCVQSVPSGCFIDGFCFNNGALNPANACQVCVAGNPLAWSGVSAGTACTDDGNDCTEDACDGAGACAHADLQNLSACTDGDANTIGDMCVDGRCETFDLKLEPLAGQFADNYEDGSPGAAGAGTNASYRIFSLVAGSQLGLMRYGSSLNGISQGFGTAADAHAVARNHLINGDVLWELIDGAWTNEQVSGSLRAAWGHVGTSGFRYEKAQLHRPTASLTRHFYGVGSLAGNDLVIRRCALGVVCQGACTWSCSDMNTFGVLTERAVDLTFFGDAPVVAANGQNPTTGAAEMHVLRYNAGQGVWYSDSALARPGFFYGIHSVGSGADERLIGVGNGGTLYVTDLSTTVEITPPGEPINARYLAVTEFRGHAVVLGAYSPGDASAYFLATSPLGPALQDSASWQLVGLFANVPVSQDVSAIEADDDYLYLIGGAEADADGPKRRALWRFEWSDLRPPTFYEAFDNGLPTSWQVVDQCPPGASRWTVRGTFIDENSGCADEDTRLDLVEKRGTFIRVTGTTLKRSATFQVDARAGDDDSYGVQWGIQDDKSYYRVSFDRERRSARMVLVRDDVFTVLAEDLDVDPPANTWHRIEVQRVGDTYTVWLDGAELFSATDATHDTGDIGLYSWGMDNLSFDDLRIRPH